MSEELTEKYPAPYAHLEDLIREARGQIVSIDERIKSFPDIGSGSAFRPPQQGKGRYDSQARVISVLEDAKAAFRTSVLAGVEAEIKDADPKIASWIRFQAHIGIEPVMDQELGQQMDDKSRTAISPDESAIIKESSSPSEKFNQSLRFTSATAKGPNIAKTFDSKNKSKD